MVTLVSSLMLIPTHVTKPKKLERIIFLLNQSNSICEYPHDLI